MGKACQPGRVVLSGRRLGSGFALGSTHGSSPRSDPWVATGLIKPVWRSRLDVEEEAEIPVATVDCGRLAVLDIYLAAGVALVAGWPLVQAAAGIAPSVARCPPHRSMIADRRPAERFHARVVRAIVIGAPRKSAGAALGTPPGPAPKKTPSTHRAAYRAPVSVRGRRCLLPRWSFVAVERLRRWS